MRWQIASPSPSPVSLVVKKGSNTRCRYSRWMPLPVSRISTTASPRDRRSFTMADHTGRGQLRIVPDADIVLEPRIQAFGVLANQHDIDIVVTSAGHDVAARPHVRVQVERLPKRHVHRPVSFTNRRFERTLECEFRAADRLERLVRHRRAFRGDAGGAGDLSVPVEVGAGRLENGEGGVGDVGPDAVTGDERARYGHE